MAVLVVLGDDIEIWRLVDIWVKIAIWSAGIERKKPHFLVRESEALGSSFLGLEVEKLFD